MGYTSYSVVDRGVRSASLGFQTKSKEELFEKKLHESMDPKNIRLRESRDSEIHPNSFPVILGLDEISR